jgi:DNA-binding MurR/RpiR family transcriptional regulator
MSKSQKKIADFILKNHESLYNISITQLASKLMIDPGSISRFCQSLGFSGYKDFKFFITHNLVSPDFEQNMLFQEPVPTLDLLEHFRIHTQKIIENIFQLLDPKAIEKAAKHIFEAKQVYFFSQGESNISAKYGHLLFLQMGMKSCFYADPHYQVTASKNVTREDVIIWISLSGNAKLVVDAVRNAKDKNAYIIGITGHQNSITGKLSDINFSYNSRLPEDLRYEFMLIACDIAIIGVLQNVIINKYLIELTPYLQNHVHFIQSQRY